MNRYSEVNFSMILNNANSFFAEHLLVKMTYFKTIRCLALLLVLGTSVYGDSSCKCGRNISNTFLDIASDMINKAKINMPTCSDVCETPNSTQHPIDCSDVLSMGHKKSGVFTIWPTSRITQHKPVNVYCDMNTDGGGWTIIQRRGNFGRPENYFDKDWKSYKDGFGDIEKDFWLGNDIIFALTNQRLYSARFDLQDVELNKAYAVYDSFWIEDEFRNYTLRIFNYSGDAGDSMTFHNSYEFSTKDHRKDRCADMYKGGWWYHDCREATLNGLYKRGKHNDSIGLTWRHWKGDKESLESTEIKIRPENNQNFIH